MAILLLNGSPFEMYSVLKVLRIWKLDGVWITHGENQFARGSCTYYRNSPIFPPCPASLIALVHIITPHARPYKGITSTPTCLFHLSFTYSNAHQSFAVPESAMGSHCLGTLLSLENIP